MKVTFRGGPKDGIVLEMHEPSFRIVFPVMKPQPAAWFVGTQNPTSPNVCYSEAVYELGADGNYHFRETR